MSLEFCPYSDTLCVQNESSQRGLCYRAESEAVGVVLSVGWAWACPSVEIDEANQHLIGHCARARLLQSRLRQLMRMTRWFPNCRILMMYNSYCFLIFLRFRSIRYKHAQVTICSVPTQFIVGPAVKTQISSKWRRFELRAYARSYASQYVDKI